MGEVGACEMEMEKEMEVKACVHIPDFRHRPRCVSPALCLSSPPAPGLTPATAGITLLALGNSAPDVFSDLAAVKNADDFALAIGELMGASMFLTTVVLGAVILFSTKGDDKCEVDRVPFLRDVAVFLLACALILVLSLTEGNLTTTEALAIIGIYLVYVAAVVTSQYVNCCGAATKGEGAGGAGGEGGDFRCAKPRCVLHTTALPTPSPQLPVAIPCIRVA